MAEGVLSSLSSTALVLQTFVRQSSSSEATESTRVGILRQWLVSGLPDVYAPIADPKGAPTLITRRSVPDINCPVILSSRQCCST